MHFNDVLTRQLINITTRMFSYSLIDGPTHHEWMCEWMCE